ncbi:hypothetical protein N0V93_002272 [Gnomoniopsis smithogilvyi]|uniref:Ubiquitin-like domain-containing protein n=1 Tax=Gnomoniopsis smithogilvyi TaxID=1191159 RepID=A0A9W8YYG5_9PEZI|nr:hypothetical protein N0V93_002272 [Gnomoniopsis smithogilvyi]
MSNVSTADLFYRGVENAIAIFTSAGHQEIETLAIKCNLIFKAVILLGQKAMERSAPDSADLDDIDRRVSVWARFPHASPSLKKSSMEQVKDEEDEKDEAEEKSELLSGPLPDLTSPQTMGSSAIVNGSFESQVIVRASVILVRKSQLKYVKHRAQKQQRAEKKSQRRLRAAQEADAESVRRSASRGTSSTAVVEEAPMLKKCNEGPIISALPYPAISSVSGLTGVIPLTADLGSHSLTQPNHADNGKDEGASKQPSPLHEIRTMVSDVMSEWTHKIFGREDEFSKDWESNELEAWVFCTSTAESAPIKVPFGHQRLQIVDEVVQEANRLQKREKVCLAFKEYNVGDGNNTFVVVFFSLCEEKAPLAFKDCIGRKMTLPFETCRTWECMSMHIVEAFRLMPEIGLHVMEGHYSLEDAKSGEHIIPGLWIPNASIPSTSKRGGGGLVTATTIPSNAEYVNQYSTPSDTRNDTGFSPWYTETPNADGSSCSTSPKTDS